MFQVNNGKVEFIKVESLYGMTMSAKCPGCNTQWFITSDQLIQMITTTNWLTCKCNEYRLTINGSGQLEFIKVVNSRGN